MRDPARMPPVRRSGSVRMGFAITAHRLRPPDGSQGYPIPVRLGLAVKRISHPACPITALAGSGAGRFLESEHAKAF
jgi:hypothetical protein